MERRSLTVVADKTQGAPSLADVALQHLAAARAVSDRMVFGLLDHAACLVEEANDLLKVEAVGKPGEREIVRRLAAETEASVRMLAAVISKGRK